MGFVVEAKRAERIISAVREGILSGKDWLPVQRRGDTETERNPIKCEREMDYFSAVPAFCLKSDFAETEEAARCFR